MPNWAMGSVEITGTKDSVLAFSKRFICDGQKHAAGEKYFARSFYDSSEESLSDAINAFFKSGETAEKRTISLDISFAWSAHCCLIDGYPQQAKDTCITLGEACVTDGVSVEIRTTESGMCFEEYISCDEHGICVSTSEELKTYKCPQCGETQGLASFEDPDEAECYECGCVGLEDAEITEGDN